MSGCPTELELSMHADRALSADAAVTIELHAAGCAECRLRLAALRSETSIVAAALARDAEPVVVPAYKRPVSRMAMVAAAVGGLLLALLVAVIPTVIGRLLSGPVAWFNPFDAGTFADLGVEAAIFVAKHSGAIMTSIAKTALMAALTSLVGWFAFARRARPRGPLLLVALVCIVGLQTLPAQALEIRHNETEVFIPAGETIDDTLFVYGETVEIAGDVTGDVVAVGRRVVLRGHVGGQVFAAAKSVTVDGVVEGSVIGVATDSLAVVSTRIGRNLYAVASTIDLNSVANVEANAIVAGERLQLGGSVGRDVLGGGESIDVSGAIGGALTAYAEQLTVLAPAQIAGDFTAYVEDADDVSISPSAVIGGELKTELMQHHSQRNEYLTGEFYLTQVFRFAAAFVTGAVLLALLPSLRGVTIDSTRNALIAGGLGLVTLVATPIIAAIVAVTVVGIPIGVFAVLAWIVGLYLAKLLVANFVGTQLVGNDAGRHYTVALALGLLLVIVTINLPFIGGALNFLLTILGLGLLVLFVWRALATPPPSPDAAG